jgi:hypothetical protein
LIQQGYASLVGENNPVRNQNDQLRVGVDGRQAIVDFSTLKHRRPFIQNTVWLSTTLTSSRPCGNH